MNTTIARYLLGAAAFLVTVGGFIYFVATLPMSSAHSDPQAEQIAADIISRIKDFSRNEGDLPASISYDILGDMELSRLTGAYIYEFGSAETEVVSSGTVRFNNYRIPAAIIRANITWIDRAGGNKKAVCHLLTDAFDKEFDMYRLVTLMNCDGSSSNPQDADHPTLSDWKHSNDYRTDFQGASLKENKSEPAVTAPDALPILPAPKKNAPWSQVEGFCNQSLVPSPNAPCNEACNWHSVNSYYRCLLQYTQAPNRATDAQRQKWRDLSAEYQALANNASRTTAVGLPQQVGECKDTKIGAIDSRLTPYDATTGSAVTLENGGYGVSYDLVPEVEESRVGDPVKMCLAEIPQNCPVGDDRGRQYTMTNERTGKSWTLPDSEHSCGGA